MSEKALETRILDWLNSIEECFAFKINNVGVYDVKRKTFRKPNNRHIHRGVSDILAVYRGTFIAIEVKYGRNKTSEHQDKFLDLVHTCGGLSFWTNDLEEVKEIFRHEFPNYEFKNKILFDEEF